MSKPNLQLEIGFRAHIIISFLFLGCFLLFFFSFWFLNIKLVCLIHHHHLVMVILALFVKDIYFFSFFFNFFFLGFCGFFLFLCSMVHGFCRSPWRAMEGGRTRTKRVEKIVGTIQENVNRREKSVREW